MVSNWIKRKQEQSYLGQLEQMLVQRIRVSDSNVELRPKPTPAPDAELSQMSREINEELDRIERLVQDFDANAPES